ncbi:selenide, water dikinase SelD [Peptoniphilus equinus]|uniref:Selenide, water dikinase n=1 Tax=Peptoniphilus equinus TaxID=3016343 RepID=A0ABY7QUX4_9FIRM|nr:selenide, water dikinase SelD [Peptoniphilus equinus]WBW50587.1 selenide, water dikinase SelD [Peptoniphilus equinus]
MNQSTRLEVCGGCNAKLSATKLSRILEGLPKNFRTDHLVGFDKHDDGAVVKLTDDLAVILSLDFFPPMVDDPYTFGAVAATNALSDIYAMGGEVVSALNILAYPESGDEAMLHEILRGGADKVKEAGATLSGGHSIHDEKMKYGLSVMGTVHPDKIWTNQGLQVGDVIILTKALGTGLVTGAKSVGEVSECDYLTTVRSMTLLNKYARDVLMGYAVHALTDVTGFGLLGHLMEMVDDSVSVLLSMNDIPILPGALEAAKKSLFTGGSERNRNYVGDVVALEGLKLYEEELLFDPQTSGGFLIAVEGEVSKPIIDALHHYGYPAEVIGTVVPREAKQILVY